MATSQRNPCQVSLTLRFIICAVTATCFFCFQMGCLARPNVPFVITPEAVMPPLVLASHKAKPTSLYTSKQFDTAQTVASDTMLSHRLQANHPLTSKERNNITSFETNRTVHEASGQHILVDLQHIDTTFLTQEHKLAKAMIDLVNSSGLTMLSYHCHTLTTAGVVSCVGVLLESHVAFHAFSLSDRLYLDLYTCGPNSILPLLEDVQALFAKPNGKDKLTLEWAYKKRGFSTNELQIQHAKSQLVPKDQEIPHQVAPTFHVVSSTTAPMRHNVSDQVLLPHHRRAHSMTVRASKDCMMKQNCLVTSSASPTVSSAHSFASS